jgi:hypothetical protein
VPKESLLTSLGLVYGYALRLQALREDVDHLAAHVDDDHRHAV